MISLTRQTRDFVARLGDEHGFSSLWVAVVALFLVAAAALAVDTSGAFNVAQTDQNTADLSCLAGVKEIPADPVDGIDLAITYAVDNWPEVAGNPTTISGTTGTYSDGSGNEVYVDAAYNGDPSTMYVRVTEVSNSYFSNALGQDDIPVIQEASCFHQQTKGVGMLPVGALAGSWSGDLFDCAAKVTGNCGALSPAGGGANAYRDAVVNGIEGDFIKHHGPQASPDPDIGYATIDCYADPCNVSRTEPGNMVGPWNQGLTARFNDPTAACTEAGWFNCEALGEVLGATPTPLGSAPAGTEAALGWEDSIYGTFAQATVSTNPDAKHHFYNGDTMDCESPRLATIPIVARDRSWDIGDPPGSWPNGRKDMKFIGFYTIYIREPITIADIGGPIDADIIWFGSEAECSDGSPFQPVGSTNPIATGVWLIAP
jgi:Flp pilus assembly protein TadG